MLQLTVMEALLVPCLCLFTLQQGLCSGLAEQTSTEGPSHEPGNAVCSAAVHCTDVNEGVGSHHQHGATAQGITGQPWAPSSQQKKWHWRQGGMYLEEKVILREGWRREEKKGCSQDVRLFRV